MQQAIATGKNSTAYNKETSVKFGVPTTATTTLLDKKNRKYVDGKNMS